MSRSEKVILTVLCMVYEDDQILLQDRVKGDWQGLTFPGGHVEKKESFVKAVIREVYEETGLTIYHPRICGIKQFQTKEEERFVIVLFKANQFSGVLTSSEEGEMQWVNRKDLSQLHLAEDFMELLQIFDSEDLNEFYYKEETMDCEICIY
ncbi:8-oxo-dGTP diphosphatase [Candidatus Galacturonibacter soehngenii]|uniref:8-oxo-dGTP diphosphatase n=1 Tax=Candidatus Galacturonatibacter soehngenii TaxID=2307010 RepID=A0A7V7QHP7_9FIRM|nr:8-oxo-dGTP diphosphatase [Candidatus Galacturonibacter soehngenii]KAB1434510.1 8-oxo-dGTP diphosphatase [Candidatus Galacturonibacter soehngenii]MBA4688186.1 8-oxo-dGTP diphosphatase [Candidatus Galacturonibacter soehngenii]